MAYNTGNPSGSSDPRDLSDSAADIDTWATSTTADTHPDRRGVSRKTWHGMENEFDADQVARASEFDADQADRESEFDADQADRAQRFDLFLANSGYQFVGDYAAGIELTEYNQVVRDVSGNLWRASASTALPYTTTGAGLPEGGAFIAIGDADLAQNLISDPSTGQGALLVRGSVIYVDSIADLQALPTSELVDGQAVIVGEMFTGSRGNQRTFVWRASVPKSEHDGGRIISPTVPFAETESGITDFLAGTGETDSSGNGVFEEWKDHFSVMDYFAFRNGIEDDSISFRHLAAMADTDRIRSIYIPNSEGTYFVKQTTVFSEPGLRLYGDAGPTYNRGTGKAGQITFDDDTFAGPIFDLGNFRTSGNPADQWTVEGLHFRKASGTGRQVDAVLHTTQTNGPDRGVLIDKCSANGMRSLFAIAAETVTNSLANLKITNSNLSNNEYGVHADGSCLGLEFTGNQAEQNTSGAIYGKFGSGITIHDNMLEGQPNTITIFPPDVGNRPKVSIKRNYFEANTGAHLISLSGSTLTCEAEIGENFYFANTYDDFCVLKSGSWRIQLTDQGSALTISGLTRVLFGSDIFPRGTDFYEIRSININTGAEVQIEKHEKFLGRDRADYTVISATGADTIYTPYGKKTDGYKTTGSTKFFGLDVGSVAAGDIVVFSVLMRSEYNGNNNTQVQVFNNTQTANLGQVSGPSAVENNSLAGGWALVQYAVEINADTSSSLLFRFFNFSGTAPDIEIASIAARNYGPIPVGGKLKIYPITII